MATVARIVRHIWLLPAGAFLAQLVLVTVVFGLRYAGFARAAAPTAAAFEASLTATLVIGPSVLLALLWLARRGRITAAQPGVVRAAAWAFLGTGQLAALVLIALAWRFL